MPQPLLCLGKIVLVSLLQTGDAMVCSRMKWLGCRKLQSVLGANLSFDTPIYFLLDHA